MYPKLLRNTRKRTYLILKLLTQLQCHGEQHQHLVQPRYRTLGLAGIELHRALEIRQLVGHEDQLVALDVETDRQILRQIRRQRLHVSALHEFIDGLLAGYHQRGPASLQGAQYVPQDVQHLVGGFKIVRTIHIVDVVYCLL